MKDIYKTVAIGCSRVDASLQKGQQQQQWRRRRSGGNTTDTTTTTIMTRAPNHRHCQLRRAFSLITGQAKTWATPSSQSLQPNASSEWCQ